jgi:hypothetical protein
MRGTSTGGMKTAAVRTRNQRVTGCFRERPENRISCSFFHASLPCLDPRNCAAYDRDAAERLQLAEMGIPTHDRSTRRKRTRGAYSLPLRIAAITRGLRRP